MQQLVALVSALCLMCCAIQPLNASLHMLGATPLPPVQVKFMLFITHRWELGTIKLLRFCVLHCIMCLFCYGSV